MDSYYRERLSAERLERCYEIAPKPVRTYLEGEVEEARRMIPPGARVLELGCGTGRVLSGLADTKAELVGIDVSMGSLRFARARAGVRPETKLAAMSAAHLAIADDRFDLVLGLQNALSAFNVPPSAVLAESARVTRPGGRLMFASYAPEFWDERLSWFRLQAEHGLIGPLDESASRDGVIVCRDGFRASTLDGRAFQDLAAPLGLEASLRTINGASLICELLV